MDDSKTSLRPQESFGSDFLRQLIVGARPKTTPTGVKLGSELWFGLDFWPFAVDT
jgi:hypothetical protein